MPPCTTGVIILSHGHWFAEIAGIPLLHRVLLSSHKAGVRRWLVLTQHEAPWVHASLVTAYKLREVTWQVYDLQATDPGSLLAALPTDDVLIVRKGKGKGKGEVDAGKTPLAPAIAAASWTRAESLTIVPERSELHGPSAMILGSLDAVRWAARYAPVLVPHLRAVIAEHIPAGIVPLLAGLGIVALTTDAATLKKLEGEKSLELPPPSNGADILASSAGGNVELKWGAVGAERQWTQAGSARSPAPAGKPSR